MDNPLVNFDGTWYTLKCMDCKRETVGNKIHKCTRCNGEVKVIKAGTLNELMDKEKT